MRHRLVLAAALGLCPAGARLHAQSIAQMQPPVNHVTVGGYGEIQYANQTGPDTPGQVNLARFVVYLANAFTDRITLRSEIEWENAKVEEGGTGGGEIAIEQLILDYRLSEAVTLRTGLLLPPLGIINETHEPPTFNGVRRPDLEHDVLPATWRELGIGAAGTIPGASGLAYRVYLLNGLKASGFSAEEGIREGRQEGQLASFANPSLTGRLEYARPGLKAGGAFWYGGSANQVPALGTGAFDAPVTVLSADARVDVAGFELRGVVANITISDAGAINAVYGGAVGSRINGGYLEGAYNLLRPLLPSTGQRLTAFLRHERYNTQASVPAGVVRDDRLARRITTVGFTYKPIGNVAFKGDYQFFRNRAGVDQRDVLNFGVGYQF